MVKLDTILRKLIIKTIDTEYAINDSNEIFDISNNNRLSPLELSEFVETSFDVPKDLSDYLIFGWLLENNFKNITDNWCVLYPTVKQLNDDWGTLFHHGEVNYIMGADIATSASTSTSSVLVFNTNGDDYEYITI